MLFKTKNSINLPEDWYEKKEYSKVIKKELNLSFRTGLPLSLVSIDLSKIKSTKPDQNSHFYNIIYFLIRFVSENMRDEDIKCYRPEGIIDILLINTAIEGAAVISKKIYDSLNDNFKNQNGDIIKKVNFNNYPLNKLAGKNIGDTNPYINVVTKSEIESQNNLFLSDREEFSSPVNNLDINVYPNGLLSVTNIYSLENSWYLREGIFLITKRAVDIIFTALTLICFSPLMILIAIAIKLSSKGPVFFKQQRYGQFQIPFMFYKFRTMKINNDDNVHREYVKRLIQGENDQVNLGTEEKPFYKIKKDNRVTKIGRFLRRTSLDELPQFFNVLKGEMSIVGPRPPLIYEVESYKNWHLRRILSVKPGITGLWQVSGKNKTTFDEMVRLDLKYSKSRSALTDILIMFKTIPAMFNTD